MDPKQVQSDVGSSAEQSRHVADFTFGTAWHQFFDGHSIQAISKLYWNRQQLPCSGNLFHPSARKIIKWIIEAHIHGRSTPVANLKKGKAGESFPRSRKFILRTGRLHTPAVLIKQPQGYQIMDGNHRIAAFFSLNPTTNSVLNAWIGTKGNKSLDSIL
jgi:hypothetical protein